MNLIQIVKFNSQSMSVCMYIQSCVCTNTEKDATSYGRTGAFLSGCLTEDQYFM